MAHKLQGQALQDAVVQAYLDGALVTDIQNRFELARSTVYAMLKRSGKVPTRFQGEHDTEKDQMIAGLRELCRYLEAEIAALKAENASLKRGATSRGRADRRSVG
jgi:hypothetical protein